MRRWKSAVKILERTPDRLRISTAWPTGVMVAFCALWGFSAFLFFRSELIQGQRTEDGTVNLRVTSRFFGLPVGRRHFEAVSQARLHRPVDPNRREGFIPHLNRVVLTTPQGTVPFSRVESSEQRRLLNLATTLEGFIQAQTRDTFQFVAPPGWIGWLLLGVFAFLVVLFAYGHGGDILIDKTEGVVTVTKAGIPKPRARVYPLNEVQGFYCQTSRDHRRGHQHWLVLKLASGTEVSLANFWTETQCHTAMARLERFRSSIPLPSRPQPEPPRETRTFAVPLASDKLCVICGFDCSTEPRFQDPQGRYYHQRCYTHGYRTH